MCSKVNKYLKLIKKTTPYALHMDMLSRQIFGEVKSKKIRFQYVARKFSERPFYKIDHFVNYYPRHIQTYELMFNLRHYGLFKDEHEDFKEEMERARILKGNQKIRKPRVKKEKPS